MFGAGAGGVGVTVELGDAVGRGLLGAGVAVHADCDVRGVDMPMGWRVVCRLMAQFRSAATAALTLPICGIGVNDPAPVVNSSVPAPRSVMEGRTSPTAVIAACR